ncbi:hypothetical protein WJX77_002133 [Trebouxia sp. C0004]
MSYEAGTSSPTRSLPATLADSGEHGAASAQQTAASLPASSIPGSTARPHMRFLAPPLSGTRRPYGSDTSQGHSPQRRRRLSLPDDSGSTGADSEAMSEGETEHETFVWGTNLVIADVQNRIRRFMRGFTQEGSSEALYTTLIKQEMDSEEVFLNIDMLHMYKYDSMLYVQLIDYPGEVIPLLDNEARSIATDLIVGQLPEDKSCTVRPFNLKENKVIRDLDPDDLNKLISVSGMVTRTSNIIPDLRIGLFRCAACGKEVQSYMMGGVLEEPCKCPEATCGKSMTMQLMHNLSEYSDKQLIKVQENPNAIPEGETPHSVTFFAHDHLVDMAKPGDRVTITGIYKVEGMRVNARMSLLKSAFKPFIDAVHISKDERTKKFTTKHDDSMPNEFSQEKTQQESEEPAFQLGTSSKEQLEAKEAELQELGADPDIYEKLTASIAPSIWQLDDVKKGVLCQLFGGCTKEWLGGRVRGEVNVLLVGDPGVSKSQLLSYVHKLAPRGIYTSGKGSSADPETKEMVLESGALVLSDQGVCCIDEFDKMSDNARSMLHEVMEQQTVSVAKAGIIATLNAKTSVLACANPVGSRYNPRISVIDNIQMPPSLLSRFDLIYLILDKADEASDKKLARHLIALFYDNPPENAQAVIPMEKLRDFIAFARARCQPELTDEAGQDLVDAYRTMRCHGTSKNCITATPRQLESTIRLSEALARMRLSPSVERYDVAEAVRLMKVAMQQSATDPTTGTIDMDCINIGVSSSVRRARSQLSHRVLALLKTARSPLTIMELVTQLNAQEEIALRCRQMLRQEEVAKGIYQQHQPRKCQIANGFFVTGFLVTGLATGKRGQSETSLCVLWPKLVHCIL